MLRLNKDGFPGNPLPQLRGQRKHPPGALSRGPRAVVLARRADACARLLDLLQAGPSSAAALSVKLELTRPTVTGYLRHMAIDMRNVRRTGLRDEAGHETWEVGEDVMLPTREEMMDSAFAQRQRVVPAKQVGMWRHPLDIAFFGAPTGSAAA